MWNFYSIATVLPNVEPSAIKPRQQHLDDLLTGDECDVVAIKNVDQSGMVLKFIESLCHFDCNSPFVFVSTITNISGGLLPFAQHISAQFPTFLFMTSSFGLLSSIWRDFIANSAAGVHTRPHPCAKERHVEIITPPAASNFTKAGNGWWRGPT